jgi:hypothetical protein
MPRIELPTSVTRLECKDCIYLPPFLKESDLDLHAMLGLAASCISAGVPLQSLCLVDCASYTEQVKDDDEDEDEDGEFMEPTDFEHAHFYRPVCGGLHGLTSLCFEYSPNHSGRCHLRTVSEVVSYAPDLTHLVVGYMSRSAGADPVLMQCKGLAYVRIDVEFCSFHRDSHAISLKLDTSARLQQVVLEYAKRDKLTSGDTLHVSLKVDRLAAVTPQCADATRPRFDVLAPGNSHGRLPPAQHAQLRQVTLSFSWGYLTRPSDVTKMGWTCALRWDP